MLLMFKCPACGHLIRDTVHVLPASTVCPACRRPTETPSCGIGPGARLGGFQIERAIGRGAMGEVFVATQLSMDRKVALKVLPAEVTADKRLIDRFRREIRLLAKVDHPHAVTAFEAGEQDGVYFLAMTHVDGENLDTRLRRVQRLCEAEALAIARQVADALGSVWDKHAILHNDVKPGNIMIDPAGVVKVMDMGLSRCMTEDTSLSIPGMTFGTPNYMSPEQARGQTDLDHRSDQYALGATLFELVTGALPHKGTNIAEVLTHKVMDPPPSARTLVPEISPACDALIRRMMATDRERRFSGWQAVVRAIDDAMASDKSKEKTRAPLIIVPAARNDASGRTPQPAAAPPRRRRAAVIASVAAAAAVCAAALWVFQQREPPAPTPVEVEVAADEEAVQGLYQTFTLEPRAPETPGVSDADISRAIVGLETANPGLRDFQVFYRISKGTVVLDMSGNPSLVDLSPLRDLPVQDLRLQGTGVQDLSPLQGMPLERLVLSDTPVKDLSPLRTLPLLELALWKCNDVEDLAPLADVRTLTHLLLPDRPLSVEPLRSHPSLGHISTSPDGWKQTAGDFWARNDTHP